MSRLEQLRNEILQAAEAAPVITLNETASKVIYSETKTFIDQNEVVLRNPDEIYDFFKLAGQIGIARASPETQRWNAIHEPQHDEAAKTIGVARSCFVGRVLKVADSYGRLSFGVQVSNKVEYDMKRHGTLHMASVTAHPQELSSPDVAGLAAMGFDVQRVGFEAEKYNAQYNGYYIPVPLSYRPKIVLPIKQTRIEPLKIRRIFD